MLVTRKFNHLNIETKLLGFGCMRFPTMTKNEKKVIDETIAEKMLDKAYQAGVNYFDTAYPYHDGQSETFVGKVLNKYPRTSYFLATKLPMWSITSKADAVRIFNEQLEKLDKDYIDFYLLHSLNKNTFNKVKEFEILDILKQYQKEGKIKYIGFSFHDSYEVFEEIIAYNNWDFCQIQFNYIDIDIQAGIKGLQLAEKKGIPVVVMEPIKGGSLASLPNDITKGFRKLQPDWSDASWALRYVATFDNVKVILSGMSTIEQVEDNLNTFANIQPLNDKEMEAIEEVRTLIQSRVKNGCTGCRYCMPCPYGVDIPQNFAIWNTYYKYGTKNSVAWPLSSIKRNNAFATACVKCGKCEKLCPQNISIRKDLEQEIADLKSLDI